jgi:nucleoside-diphosphate-sugar epimerase
VRIDKTIAVTGASGFIGQRVCSHLVRQGYSVRALTRDPSRIGPGVQTHLTPDLRSVELLRTGLRGVNAVIHLAGRAHVMSDRAGDAAYREVNVDGTRAVALAAAAESVGQLIFASSVKAIGEGGDVALSDSTPEQPRDAYGRSKLEAERLLFEISERERLPVTVLRFPLVYGPGVKGNVRRLFDAVWRGFPIPVGGVHNMRSMLGVDNVLLFVSRILAIPIASRRPFLLSDAETVSTESLVKLIGTGLGRKPRIITLPISLLRGIARVGDVLGQVGLPIFSSNHLDRLTGSMIIDSSRAWREAGIGTRASLEEGITRTAEWYLNNIRD